jgi:hypothetical protein
VLRFRGFHQDYYLKLRKSGAVQTWVRRDANTSFNTGIADIAFRQPTLNQSPGSNYRPKPYSYMSVTHELACLEQPDDGFVILAPPFLRLATRTHSRCTPLNPVQVGAMLTMDFFEAPPWWL